MTSNHEQITIAGHSITIRPLRAADKDMEAAFVRALSDETRHYRFLGGVKELSAAELQRLCNIDGQKSMAFVATIEENGVEKQIGVSRYADGDSQHVKEMAVTVADAWQHRGLGCALARHLIDYARTHGVKQMYSIDLADNAGMRHLANDLGMNAKRNPEDANQVIYSLVI